MPYTKYYFSILIIVFLSHSSLGQLSRRGQWDATLKFQSESGGVLVTGIVKGGAADQAKLKNGDLITRIDQISLESNLIFTKKNRSLRSDQEIDLLVKRGQEVVQAKIKLSPVAKEKVDGLDIEYGSLVTERGYQLRTVVTKPIDSKGKLPGILFIQWLSCSNVEGRGENHGFSNLIWNLAKEGYVVLRTEKPGVGDSQGPDCSDLDFEGDLSFHKASLDHLKSLEGVDPDRIIVFGGSMGGAMAPLLVSKWKDPSIIGVVSNGGYVKSWYEHMLENRRRIMTFQNLTPGDVNASMKLVSELYTLYLISSQSPSEIFKHKPYLKDAWSGVGTHQYGRPVSFYQQANAYNIAKAWEEITIPVLSMYNEFDWIMSKEDHEMIVDIVNMNHPENARFIEVKKTDHNWYYYPDSENQKEAFNKRSKIPNKRLPSGLKDWLESLPKL